MGNAVISKILFQPPTPPNALSYFGESTNLKVTYLWIYSSNGTLIPALHVTHPNANDDSSTVNARYGGAGAAGKYTLLYSHGNAEDLGLIAHFLTDLARLLGVNVLCYDYAGYGKSTDVVSVSCFLREYGQELEGWKRNKSSSNRADTQGDDDTIFVAPMVYPQSLDGAGDEFDFIDDETEDDLDDGNSSCLGSCDGDAGYVYGREEKEEDSGGYFTNACGASNYEFQVDGGRAEGRLFYRSNNQRMEETRPLPKYFTNGNSDGRSMSPKARRRNLLARHSWTAPAPSEQQCYNDIQSAFEYLTRVKKVPPKNILMYGKSVGSGPTCWLAQKLCTESHPTDDSIVPEGREECNDVGNPGIVSQAPGGVILHSPFLSVIRVVLDVGFTAIGDLFPNVDRVNDFTCPVYVIHGTQDEIVPFYHGEALFNLIPDSSKTVPFWARGAGHNNIEMEMPTAYIKRLQQFIRQCDRLLYPTGKSTSVPNKMMSACQPQLPTSPVKAFNDAASSGEMHTSSRPVIKRYASQDSSNWAANAQSNTFASNYHLSGNDHLVQEQKSMNKQRKQRGTLVMKSSHNSKQQMNYPVGTSQLTSTSQPNSNAEWRQKQLLMEQYQQQRLQLQGQAASQQYLSQTQQYRTQRGQYLRTNSVPVAVSQQAQVAGGVGSGARFAAFYGRE
eukprot:CCRYP_008456-RD/>CCRYP_008456-RD protein AED:0.27 eAED:0.27 QI:381/1/1/1/0.5/0.4/5/1028/671